MFMITAAANVSYFPVFISFAFHFVNSSNTLVTAFSSFAFLPFKQSFCCSLCFVERWVIKGASVELDGYEGLCRPKSQLLNIYNVFLRMLQSDWLHYSLIPRLFNSILFQKLHFVSVISFKFPNVF